MQPGIDDKVLYELDLNNLKDHKINKINTILNKLSTTTNTEVRIQGIRKLVDVIKYSRINSLGEFISFLNLSCKIYLLRNLPIHFRIELNELLNNVFLKTSPEWEYDPSVLHEITKMLYNFLSDDLNLIYLIRNIIYYNKFSYYVGLSLMWTSFRHRANIEIKCFRLYNLNEFNNILKSLPILDLIKNLESLINFLRLYLLFQNLYVIKETEKGDHGVYSPFFEIDKTEIGILREWFEELRIAVEAVTDINIAIYDLKRREEVDDKKQLIRDIINLDIMPKLSVDTHSIMQYNDDSE